LSGYGEKQVPQAKDEKKIEVARECKRFELYGHYIDLKSCYGAKVTTLGEL
jgi:hypothetical protein